MEAVLKYPGAKNRLAEWIISFIPEHRVYNEILNGWSKAQKQTQAEHGLKRIETVWFNYAKEYQLKF